MSLPSNPDADELMQSAAHAADAPSTEGGLDSGQHEHVQHPIVQPDQIMHMHEEQVQQLAVACSICRVLQLKLTCNLTHTMSRVKLIWVQHMLNMST